MGHASPQQRHAQGHVEPQPEYCTLYAVREAAPFRIGRLRAFLKAQWLAPGKHLVELLLVLEPFIAESSLGFASSRWRFFKTRSSSLGLKDGEANSLRLLSPSELGLS